MKKLLSFAAVAILALSTLPGFATPTKSLSATQYPPAENYSSFVVAAKTDTVGTTGGNIDSKLISNLGGRIKSMTVTGYATDQAGTSPTLQLQFIGSNDGTHVFVLQSNQGSTAGTTANMQTSAADVSTASTTAVTIGMSTDQFNRNGGFPAYVGVRAVITGTSTPGVTFTENLQVVREEKDAD